MIENINENTLDWLKSAITYGEKQILFVNENSAVSSDGIRLHAINVTELPEHIHNIDMLPLFDNEDLKSSFIVNPKYLLNALQIFVSEYNSSVQVELVGSDENGNKRIVISNDSKYIAIVMCIKDKSEKENE